MRYVSHSTRVGPPPARARDRKSTRLNSSHGQISYAVFCLKKNITVDDVIDALVEEHTEDVQRFGGMEALDMPYTQIGFFSMIGKRAPWLAALLLSEMLKTTAMGHFQGELAKAGVLALFVPLIISSGGNSGSQATSLIIRSLALGEIKLRDWW